MQRKKGGLRKIVTRLFLAVFAVYAVVSLVDMQVNLAQRRQELEDVQARYEALRIEGKELARKVAEDLDLEDRERIARENDYVAPDEKVFRNISGK
jgi:cell division protein FtsB